MKILLWNTEWAKPRSARGKIIKEIVNDSLHDVVCLTEAHPTIFPEHGNLIMSNPDYGYPNKENRRKVALWSKSPWEQVCEGSNTNLPPGRYISGVTKGVRFLAVCIPWKDAHVRTGKKDKSPWQDHKIYLQELKKIVIKLKKQKEPIVLLGDFNQRFPRTRQPEEVYKMISSVFEEGLQLHTGEKIEEINEQLIDHVSTDLNLKIDQLKIIKKQTKEGLKLSDHHGLTFQVKAKANQRVNADC